MSPILHWLRDAARLPGRVLERVKRRSGSAESPSGRELNPPGPSPWCLRRMRIQGPAGILKWSSYDGPTLAGISRLHTPEGNTLVLVDFNCYITCLANGRLLLWCDRSRTSTGEPVDRPLIHFDLIDVAFLEPIAEPDAKAARMREAEQHRFLASRPLAEYEFSTARPAGKHSLRDVPAQFRDLAETLVLADFQPDETSGTLTQRRAIYAFRFREGQVEVVPQDWFNNGEYDFGYQWITRVARDPKTGQLLGEGVRLRAFRLGASGREVEEWLDRSPFRPTTE
jgi:hypothetical protein